MGDEYCKANFKAAATPVHNPRTHQPVLYILQHVMKEAFNSKGNPITFHVIRFVTVQSPCKQPNSTFLISNQLFQSKCGSLKQVCLAGLSGFLQCKYLDHSHLNASLSSNF